VKKTSKKIQTADEAKKPLSEDHEEGADAGIKIPDLVEGEHPEGEEGEPDLAAVGAVAEEAEVPEAADEVSFDDLTDDEREALGLEAKPVKHEDGDDDAEPLGHSWQEFGYDEEELQ